MKYLLSLMITVSSLFAFAQNPVTDSSTMTVPYWEKGDNQTYEIRKIKKEFKKGKLVEKKEASYKMTITVLEQTDSSYTVEWQYSDFKTKSEKKEAAELANQLLDGLRIVYKIDELGNFLEVVNHEEIIAYLKKTNKELIHSMGKTDKRAQKAYDQMNAMIQTKQGVEIVVMKEIQLYHNIYGVELILGEVLQAPAEFQNGYGGEPFPGYLTAEMTDLDQEGMTCKVKMLQTMDTKEGSRIIRESLIQIAEDSGLPKPKEEDLPVLKMKDDYIYHFELIEGWMKKINYRRTITTDDTRRVDQILIKAI